MRLFDIFSLLIGVVALSGYANYRWLKLPAMVGVTAVGFCISMLLLGLGSLYPNITQEARSLISTLDLSNTLLHGLLGLLLFSGAMQADVSHLNRYKGVILLLATFSVIISTFVVGTLLWGVLRDTPLRISYLYCLVFGALISPTDPVAILSVLKRARIPEALRIKIAGESLLNDGVAVVLFISLLSLATGEKEFSAQFVYSLFLHEVGGGVLFGLLLGGGVVYLLRGVDDYAVSTLLTLFIATGGYTLAGHVQVSEPLTVVVAGLMVGNRGKKYFITEKTKENMFHFWELLDELINMLLFGLLGLQVLALTNTWLIWSMAVLAIPLALLGRWVSVGIPLHFLGHMGAGTPKAIPLMTWGGIKGAISVALALSLPEFEGKSLLVASAYSVAWFSLLIQALTLEKLVNRLIPSQPPA